MRDLTGLRSTAASAENELARAPGQSEMQGGRILSAAPVWRQDAAEAGLEAVEAPKLGVPGIEQGVADVEHLGARPIGALAGDHEALHQAGLFELQNMVSVPSCTCQFDTIQ
jgi:hypothetical protein